MYWELGWIFLFVFSCLNIGESRCRDIVFSLALDVHPHGLYWSQIKGYSCLVNIKVMVFNSSVIAWGNIFIPDKSWLGLKYQNQSEIKSQVHLHKMRNQSNCEVSLIVNNNKNILPVFDFFYRFSFATRMIRQKLSCYVNITQTLNTKTYTIHRLV